MKALDAQLNRLFRAAALNKDAGEMLPPFGLETRVLAAWREGSEPVFWPSTVLFRGLIAATVVMAASFLPILSQNTNPTSDALQLADSDVQLDVTP